MDQTEVEIRNYTHTLPNRLTLVLSEMLHVHTVEVGMFVRAGLRFEDQDNNGISHFLEHMMFRGNKKYPDSISLNKEFEEYLEELNAEGENIDINNHACKLLYDDNPLAWPTIGTENTINAIDENMLHRYFRNYYIPQNMILCVAGPIVREHIMHLAERHFDNLPTVGQAINKNHFYESIVENQTQPAFAYQYDIDSQIQMQICFRAVSYNHPDYYAVYLINRIFDDGISSRIQRALREKLGLAYSIECRATSLSDVGTFDFDVTVSKERIMQVAETIFEEIKIFVKSGADSEELEHVKKRYGYELDFDLDDPYKQIQRYGFAELFSRQVTLEEEKEIIQNVSLGKINAIAKHIFARKNLNLILVGPFTPNIQAELEKLANQF